MNDDRRKFVKASAKGIGSLLLSSPLLASKSTVSQQLAEDIKKEMLKTGSNNLKILYPKGSLPNLQPVAALVFKQVGLKLQLIEGELQDLPSQMTLEHRLGKPPSWDIALPPTFAIPNLAVAEIITELDTYLQPQIYAYLDKGEMYTLGDYYRGKRYGFQADGDVYLMFYNYGKFVELGLSKKFEDTFSQKYVLPRTWKELDRDMKFVSESKTGLFGGSLYRTKGFVNWEYWLRLHALGVTPFDANFRSCLGKEEALEALVELVEVTKYLKPDSLQNGLFENFESFSKGNSFCNIGWGGTQKYLMANFKDPANNLQYALPPGGITKNKQKIPLSLFNWGWNYCVNSRSKQKRLAALFCALGGSERYSTISVQGKDGYFDPHHEAHYRDPQINEIYSPEFLRIHKKAMSTAMPDFYIQENNLFLSALERGIMSAVKGELKPKMALKLVNKKWIELAKNKKLKSDWIQLQENYQQSSFKHYMK